MDDYTLRKLSTELFNKYMKVKTIPKNMTEANLMDREEFKSALLEALQHWPTAEDLKAAYFKAMDKKLSGVGFWEEVARNLKERK